MKKLLFLLLFSSLFAFNYNQNVFIGFYGGKVKIHDTKKIYGGKVGFYFYDENRYHIVNRAYLDVFKVDVDNADFYVTSGKLDWMKNITLNGALYLGLNIGYLYYKYSGIDYSTNVWGWQGGFMYQFGFLGFDLEFCYQKPYEKKDIWNTPLKELKLSLEFNF